MTKALSLNEIRRRAAQFVVDWRDEPGDERQQAQSFVGDLLRTFGITGTKAALYEKRAKRSSTGHRGYIDALVPGLCLIEMKSAGKDLAVAERQALDYVDDLPDVEAPRWIITSDFHSFRVLDLKAEDGADTETFTLEHLPRNVEALAFLAGYQTRAFGDQQQEAASIKAANIMADLYEALSDSGYDDHDASVFLVRVLFCLYADDSGVWERDLFYEFLEQRTAEDGTDLGPQLAFLFQAMNRPADRRQKNIDEIIARFPYVNGGIFAEPAAIPSFDSAMRRLLIQACAFNWSDISPAIFGSLFQAVKSAKARRELGEHYTTETNILKTIEPLFLDELRDRLGDAHDAKSLKRLRTDLSKLRIMDPACGCGNFLVVAYRELRKLDRVILKRLQLLGDTSWQSPTAFFLKEDLPVTLDHLAGIEIEEWPARIASTALHLADHQANQAMELALGQAPDPLPLDRIESVHVANALRTDWTTVMPPSNDTIIVGNPPFIGMSRMSLDQQSDRSLVFSKIDSEGLRTGRLDYVASWYAKTIDYLRHTRSGRAAFVSTNSLVQGEQARTMGPLLVRNGFEVDFAHQTFKWTSEAPEAAAVHCVIVGFSPLTRRSKRRRLYTYKSVTSAPIQSTPKRLTFHLSDAGDFVPEKLRRPLVDEMPMAHKGSQPTDGLNLIVTEEDVAEVRADAAAQKYLRRFVQGKDMLNDEPRRWCLWLKDADPADIRSSQLLRQRLEAVSEARRQSATASVRTFANQPRLFTQDRQPTERYFALPEVSSENRVWIPGRFYDADVIAGNKLIIFPGAQEWHAGLLQSSMFMAWARRFAGRMKSDFSISPGLTYFPIPFPIPSDTQRDRLTAATEEVFAERNAHPDATLADLYEPTGMPTGLLKAHKQLDRVVDRLSGAKRPLESDAERMKILEARCVELAS